MQQSLIKLVKAWWQQSLWESKGKPRKHSTAGTTVYIRHKWKTELLIQMFSVWVVVSHCSSCRLIHNRCCWLISVSCERNGHRFHSGATYKENCNLWWVWNLVKITSSFLSLFLSSFLSPSQYFHSTDNTAFSRALWMSQSKAIVAYINTHVGRIYPQTRESWPVFRIAGQWGSWKDYTHSILSSQKSIHALHANTRQDHAQRICIHDIYRVSLPLRKTPR